MYIYIYIYIIFFFFKEQIFNTIYALWHKIFSPKAINMFIYYEYLFY